MAKGMIEANPRSVVEVMKVGNAKLLKASLTYTREDLVKKGLITDVSISFSIDFVDRNFSESYIFEKIQAEAESVIATLIAAQ